MLLLLIFFGPANIFFIKLHKFMKAIRPHILFLLEGLISLKHLVIITPTFPLILIEIIVSITPLTLTPMIPCILYQNLISPR